MPETMHADTPRPTLTIEEQALFDMLKDVPDWDCFPLPLELRKKFGLKPMVPIGPREFIESGYTMQMAMAPKDLPPIILTGPQRDGWIPPTVAFEAPALEIVEERDVPIEGPGAALRSLGESSGEGLQPQTAAPAALE
jgi:hypothetical protein